MAFGYYRALTVDHTKVGASDLPSFPVGIVGTYAWLATVANGGRVQHASGYDIRPYADAALTQPLDYELVSYAASSGAIELWVRIPSLSHTVDTTIYLAHGDASISTDGSSTAVWDSSFGLVAHLGNGATLSAKDSTGKGNGTIQSSPTPTAVAGKLGGAAAITGGQPSAGNGGITVPDRDTLSVASAAAGMTLSAWCYRTAAVTGTIAHKYVFATGIEYVFGFLNTGDFYGWRALDGSHYVGRTAVGVAPINQWDHYVFTWQDTNNDGAASDYKLYRNGVQVDTGTFGATTIISNNTATPFGIGNYSDGLGGGFPGYYDEVRFSQVARSADWITAEYNNQSSPATFYAVGSETPTSSNGGAATGAATASAAARLIAAGADTGVGAAGAGAQLSAAASATGVATDGALPQLRAQGAATGVAIASASTGGLAGSGAGSGVAAASASAQLVATGAVRGIASSGASTTLLLTGGSAFGLAAGSASAILLAAAGGAGVALASAGLVPRHAAALRGTVATRARLSGTVGARAQLVGSVAARPRLTGTLTIRPAD